MKNDKEKINRFERHPLRTLLIVIFTSIILLDFFAANIYKLINGYPWSEKKHVLQDMMFKEAQEIESSYRIKSIVYHHDLAKNISIDNSIWGYLSYRLCTNSLGFKDRTVRDIPLYSHKHRIVFIGDSFTEGTGFSYDDTFVGLIDKELSKKGIEVFNAAVTSYSPIIYWKKIEYLIKNVGFKFDEVVVFLDISDIQDVAIFYFLDKNGHVEQRNEDYLEWNKIFDITKDEDINFAEEMIKNSKSFLKNNSILIYYFTDKLININFRDNVSMSSHKSLWTVDKNLYDEYGEKGLKECALYMDKLYILLQSRGISLTVAVYPWPGQVLYDSLNSIHVLYWRKWCAQHNVSFINYFPNFLTGNNKKEKERIIDKYYLRNDVHFNEHGHKMVADVFLNYYNARKNKNI